MRTALVVAVGLALCGTASAATVDPIAIAMQLSIKKALQANMTKQVPGMKVTTVKCTSTNQGRRGTCRANFVYKTVKGFYMLNVKQPATGRPSYRSTSVRCFDARSGKAVSC